ncbi:MAG: tetratricopeptide repeat protein [Anaerolineae bacterium]|nr:tetratricopeptide repeat protein [Anaerolineae bacterium]
MTVPSIADLIDESLALERAGEIAAALDRARQALDVAQSAGEPGAVAAALVAVARFRFRMGQYSAARALAEEALALAASEAPARADALLMLGMCAAETESLAEAEDYYRRAADLAREIGEHLLRFRALNNLGTTVYFPRGQFDLALAALQEALRLARQQGWDEWLPYPLLGLAWVYQFTGQMQRAREMLDGMKRVAQVAAVTEGYHVSTSAQLALDEADLEAAPPLLAQARAVAESTGDAGLGVEARIITSRYHRLTGSGPAARDWADDALSMALRTGYHHEQGQALIERGRAAWALGDGATAEADLRAAIDVMAPLPANFDIARAALFLAALLHSQRRPEARQAWQEAARRVINGGYAFLLEQERALAFPLVAAHLGDPDPETAALSAALLTHLERVPPPPLHVVALGRFEVWQGARLVPEAAWRQRRAGELFRLLLTSTRRRLSRDQVIEALWPDKPPGAANTPFHQATSALRQALEPDLPDKFPSRYLEVEGGQVALHLPPGSTIDLDTFEHHARQSEWAAAAALYGGALFPDDRYADWAAEPRERLAQLFVEVALALARQALEGGHPREALASARRVLGVDPWQENAVLVGMRACLALEDRVGALRLYRDLEQALRQDLGVAPQVELQELYQSLVSFL